MKVSVVVPAYNAAQYLAETLDNLLSQTLQDVEIVVVNDGSTDGTQGIIDTYSAAHARLRGISQANAGVSAARNRGLAQVSEEYVLFMDSDDLLTPDALELLVRRLDTTGADMAICRLATFGAGPEQYNPYAEAIAKSDTIDPFDKRLLWNCTVSNRLYRREPLVASGMQFPPYRFCEDGAFYLQYVLRTRPKIVGEYGATLRYRRHFEKDGLSVSQSISLQLAQDFCNAMELIYRTAEQALAGREDAAAYLQEILTKKQFMLVLQFYRLLWRADTETLAYVQAQNADILARMTPQTQKKAKATYSDLPQLEFQKAAVAANPQVSVIVKSAKETTVHALYRQSMPQFELLVPQHVFDRYVKGSPWEDCENLVVLPDKGFARRAKKAAKAKRRLSVTSGMRLDERLLRLMLRVSHERSIPAWLFQPLYYAAAFLLARR